MSSTFRSTNSTRRSSLYTKPILSESTNQISKTYTQPTFEKNEKSPSERSFDVEGGTNRDILKFNENTYSFAKILNQIVEKVCDDIETRLSKLEMKIAKMEKERDEKNNDFKENHSQNSNKNHFLSEFSFENLQERLENLEEGLGAMKSEFYLKQGQLKKVLDVNKEKIFEEINKKMEDFKKEITGEGSSIRDLRKNIEKVKLGLEEEEIMGENLRVSMRRIEDDFVRVLAGMKDVNELKVLMKIEIDKFRREFQEIGSKRGRSYREKY